MSFETWLGTDPYVTSAASDRRSRAILAWRNILDNPSSIAFVLPDGSTLAAQTVKIESDNRASPMLSEAGESRRRNVVIFGVRSHPTVADTVILKGYIFNIGKDRYTVKDIVLPLGEVQALAELTR